MTYSIRTTMRTRSFYFKPWRMSVAGDWRLWRLGIRRPRPSWQSWGFFVGPLVIQFWIKNGTAVVTIPARAASPEEAPK